MDVAGCPGIWTAYDYVVLRIYHPSLIKKGGVSIREVHTSDRDFWVSMLIVKFSHIIVCFYLGADDIMSSCNFVDLLLRPWSVDSSNGDKPILVSRTVKNRKVKTKNL